MKFQSRKKKCNRKCWDFLTKQGEVPKMSAIRWSPKKCGEAIPNRQTKNHQKLPGTQMTSIFEGQPPQNKALSIQSKGPHLGSRYWNAPSHFFGTFFQLYRKRQEAAGNPSFGALLGKVATSRPIQHESSFKCQLKLGPSAHADRCCVCRGEIVWVTVEVDITIGI